LLWKREGTEEYLFTNLLEDLHAKYNFSRLPDNYFFQRSPLPKLPSEINLPENAVIPATTVQDARRLSRYLYPLYDYKIPLDKNWIDLSVDKRIPLPSSMKIANETAGANFPIYRTNLISQVHMLRKYYKFRVISDLPGNQICQIFKQS